MSTTPVSSTSAAGSDSVYARLAPKAPETDVTKNMFMQLLVAQLKNQDPTSPSDPTQFVTQLAQFEQLEQSVNSAQDLAAARQDLDQLVKALGADTTTTQSGS